MYAQSRTNWNTRMEDNERKKNANEKLNGRIGDRKGEKKSPGE